MGNIESSCSWESQLFFLCIFSIRILKILIVIAKNVHPSQQFQMQSAPQVSQQMQQPQMQHQVHPSQQPAQQQAPAQFLVHNFNVHEFYDEIQKRKDSSEIEL